MAEPCILSHRSFGSSVYCELILTMQLEWGVSFQSNVSNLGCQIEPSFEMAGTLRGNSVVALPFYGLIMNRTQSDRGLRRPAIGLSGSCWICSCPADLKLLLLKPTLHLTQGVPSLLPSAHRGRLLAIIPDYSTIAL